MEFGSIPLNSQYHVFRFLADVAAMLAAHSLLFGAYDPSTIGFSLFSLFQCNFQLSMHETRIQCRSFYHRACKYSISLNSCLAR